MSKAEKLLRCAVSYYDHKEEPKPISNTFSSISEGIQSFMDVLMLEAHENFQQPIDEPEDPFLHPVDVDTTNPGIVASKDATIIRKELPLEKINYRKRQPPQEKKFHFDSINTKTIEEAVQTSDKLNKKHIRSQERKALKELKLEEKSLKSLERKENNKKQKMEETQEEREERLEKMRQKRKEKKELKKEALEVENEAHDTKNNDESKKCDNDEVVEDNTNENMEDDNVSDSILVIDENNIEQILENECCSVYEDSSLPKRIKAKQSKLRYFNNPIPFDRHLAALEVAFPTKKFEDTLLHGKHCNDFKLIQGPPGTGKTVQLLNELKNNDSGKERILICAPTNVAVCNIYSRAINMGIECSIVMPVSKMAPDTPVISQNPQARIVCSTISSRSGSLLDSEEFQHIYVDEAAQTMEAWIWGLLRPEVEIVVMSGDIHQLPALVSSRGMELGYDRSIMERLFNLDYPMKYLDTQYRMNPELIEFPNKLSYEGKLKTNYTPIKSEIKPYMVITHNNEETEIGNSYYNYKESMIVVAEALKLKETFSDVVIITPYKAQYRQILSLKSGISVFTVDSFQGREADVVVLSIVRGNNIGFWTDIRRLTVALTRAKHILRVCGQGEIWSGPLQQLFNDANSRNLVSSTN